MNTTPEKEKTPKTPTNNDAGLKKAFELCVRKARTNIKRLADDPKSAAWAENGNYFDFPEGFYDIGNWTSSFFTGMALIAWQETEDEYFLKQVQRLAPYYMEKVFTRHRNTHHDLGFLYSLYSVALYRLTGDEVQRKTALRAAGLLAARFNPKGNFIRAWGRTDTDEHDNMAIVDSLMNLPLLFWATRETGDSSYHEVALRHAATAADHFVRSDDSVCHAFRFNLNTGKPIGPENFCGRGVDSFWARGAAWAIYGFALISRYSEEEKYLKLALRLARKFITELDGEIVPVWDFRLPASAPPVRDTSAALVAVCGFQELAKHHVTDFEISKTKFALLDRVCAGYLDSNDDCPGVLKSAYGDKPAYSSWGDYFLMEALARELSGFEGYW